MEGAHSDDANLRQGLGRWKRGVTDKDCRDLAAVATSIRACSKLTPVARDEDFMPGRKAKSKSSSVRTPCNALCMSTVQFTSIPKMTSTRKCDAGHRHGDSSTNIGIFIFHTIMIFFTQGILWQDSNPVCEAISPQTVYPLIIVTP
jgi:hypothetical protein